MQISFSDESIEELRQLAEVEFGEPCTTEEAREMANAMGQMCDLLARL